MMKQCRMKRKRIILSFFFLTLLAAAFRPVRAGDKESIPKARKGIVEIFYGIRTEDGSFHRMKQASGSVIAHGEKESYILTAYDSVHAGEKEKKDFCKKQDLPSKNMAWQDNDVIQVVSKGDVTVEADYFNGSQKKNIALLKIERGLAEKRPVCLGSSDKLQAGDQVYSLGFGREEEAGQEEEDPYREYKAEDVVVSGGSLKDPASDQDGIPYLQHTAMVSKGSQGGPLVDKDGCLVGLNNYRSPSSRKDAFYSLPAAELRDFLDDLSIPYDSTDRRKERERLEDLLSEGKDLLASNEYKSKSKRALRKAVEEGEALLSAGTPDEDAMQAAVKKLQDGKKQLVRKMRWTRKVMIALAFVLLFLFLWMLKLLVWKIRASKKVEEGLTGKKSDEERTRRPLPDYFLEEAEKAVQELEKPDRKGKAMLIHNRTGQAREVDRPRFYIGERADNDFVIQKNTVSRRHACIIYEGRDYSITDMNSLNGTMVNGIRIRPGEKARLKGGEGITLADEELTFQIYPAEGTPI